MPQIVRGVTKIQDNVYNVKEDISKLVLFAKGNLILLKFLVQVIVQL